MTKKIDQLHSFLEKYLEWLTRDGGSGYGASSPEMELYPDDYLIFAEENIHKYHSSKEETTKINELLCCISNLKRALESQIECFLFCYHISNHSKKKNLSLSQKLRFISDIGIFSSRTIDRFILLRNEIEHKFKKPKIADIEALYDLVVAFVALLKKTMSDINEIDQDFLLLNSEELVVGTFSASIDFVSLKITFEYLLFPKPISFEEYRDLQDRTEEWTKLVLNSTVKLDADIEEREAFEYFFRCLLTLSSLDSYGSWEHVKKKIEPNPSKT